MISSSVDPHLTFEVFMEPKDLPSDFLESVGRYKFRGSSGKVNLALSGLPNFRALPGVGAHLRGAMSISPGMEYMERAYDDAKYGHFSKRPYIDMVIPSLTDPSVAPPGKHVLSCFVQYAPYKLAEGTWDDQREAFGNNVIDTIAEHAPNIKDTDHRQASADAARSGAGIRIDARKYFSRRTFARAAVLPAAGAGLGVLPHTGGQPLYVRLGDASGRRNHGRERQDRQPGHPERMEEGGELTMPIGQKVVLIGGGHNALITAYYLAKGGFKPVVLERREMVGGGAVTEEFHPGFKASTLAHTLGPLRADIAREMQLERFNLQIFRPDPASVCSCARRPRIVVLRRRGENGGRDFAFVGERWRAAMRNSRSNSKRSPGCSARLRRSRRRESISLRQKICGIC